jgi:hypothetical protein
MILHNNKKLLYPLVNKQFEMIGVNITLEKLDETGGIIKVGNKKMEWWKHYQFPSEELYIEWREWVEDEIEKEFGKFTESVTLTSEINYVDLVYGMSYKIKRTGELF